MDSTTSLAVLPGQLPSLIKYAQASDVASMVLAGRVQTSDLATTLAHVSEEKAREILAELPAVVQASVTHACVGGGDEAPLLALMPSPQATTSVMIDTACFMKAGDIDLVLEGFFRADEIGNDEVEAEKAARTIPVTTPSGEERWIPVVVSPERAMVYLLSILRAVDISWRNEMFEALGPELLAFVLAANKDGRLLIDADVYDELCTLTPRAYRSAAFGLLNQHDNNPVPIEADLIDRHAASMAAAFSLEHIDLAAASQSADELVGGLDLD